MPLPSSSASRLEFFSCRPCRWRLRLPEFRRVCPRICSSAGRTSPRPSGACRKPNAQIGVAKAAYFPLFTLTGSGGLESAAISTLIQGPSAFWTLGGAAAQTIFEGGARRGAVNQAYALRDQAVATYRQTVLTAFQEVEDNLAALRILQDEAHTEDAAVAAAQHSLALSITRYKGGIANYLEVTTAQSAALADEVTAVNILTRRIAASVQLVKALGGGWNVSQIPRV